MNLVLLLTSLLLNNPELEWKIYKMEFNKQYSTTEEDLIRKEIFQWNSIMIKQHNQRNYQYSLSHNQFSDQVLLEADYQEPQIIADDAIDMTPSSIDWRSRGAVTPVKDEGNCKASWAFSATGALEGQLYRSTKKLQSLSEQNLLDCTNFYGNRGCLNGTALNAYKYILQNGISTNRTYPWRGRQYYCHRFGSPIKIHTIIRVPNNEQALAEVIAKVGPVSAAISTNRKFTFYHKGLFQDCTAGAALSREVLVVGYTRSAWIIKNSWGQRWGMSGYMYLKRNGRNLCGITTRALYPVV